MTPLAAQLSKQLTMPEKDRYPFWKKEKPYEILFQTLNRSQFFEVTKILSLARTINDKIAETKDTSGFSKLSFLPSPWTWIEFNDVKNTRVAFHFIGHADKTKENAAHLCLYWSTRCSFLGTINLETFRMDFGPYKETPLPPWFEGRTNEDTQNIILAYIAFASSSLIAINSPQIISQEKKEPNRGLIRRINKKFGAKNFPVNDWTELQLKISKPESIDDGQPHEDHITGKRALHFCRQHIRIRNNKLGYVTGHWRGDATIGVRQKSYTVKP